MSMKRGVVLALLMSVIGCGGTPGFVFDPPDASPDAQEEDLPIVGFSQGAQYPSDCPDASPDCASANDQGGGPSPQPLGTPDHSLGGTGTPTPQPKQN